LNHANTTDTEETSDRSLHKGDVWQRSSGQSKAKPAKAVVKAFPTAALKVEISWEVARFAVSGMQAR